MLLTNMVIQEWFLLDFIFDNEEDQADLFELAACILLNSAAYFEKEFEIVGFICSIVLV